MARREPARAKRGAPRLHAGEAIAGAAAAALLVTTFFPWYGVKVSGQVGTIEFVDTSVGRTAWQTLEVVPVLLALAAAVALGVVLLRLLRSPWRPAIALGAAVAVLGGLAFLVVLLRILAPPDLGAVGGVELEASPGFGAFVGLAASLGVAYGGYRAMREEGSSFAAAADSLQPRKPRSGQPASRRR